MDQSAIPQPKSGAGELPPLSAADFRVYNALSEKMNSFHNHFRQQWTTLHQAAEKHQRPARMTLRQLLSLGLSFCSQLEMHHGIEENHVFPMLGARMPAFSTSKEGPDLLAQHRRIHAGLVKFEEYMKDCRDGERDFEWNVMLEKMDAFGGVLWEHLDEEVQQLRADEMRKYWSKDEILRMPF